MLNDLVTNLLSPDQIRAVAIWTNFISALVIGLWMAWATTHGAGVRCRVALTRLVARITYVGLAIILMNNAMTLYSQDRVPIASALLLNIFVFLTTMVSAYRHVSAPDIPPEASWEHPMLLKAEVL